MKCWILAFACLLALTASCTSTLEQQAAFVTAMPSIAAVTPVPSDTTASTSTPARTTTPTETPIPTTALTNTTTPTNAPIPTATPTNTATNTPIPTATPTPMPDLMVSGTKFVADNKAVILRGAVAVHAYYDVDVDVFKRDVLWMSVRGANFVILHWTASFLERPGYIDRLVTMLEYAKSKEMYVELALRGGELKPGSSWDPQGLDVADEKVYLRAWDTLLADRRIAQRVGNAVDIVCPAAELATSPSGEWVTWAEAKGLEQKVIELYRRKTGNNRVIGALTSPAYAGDARGVANDPPDLDNMAIEIHPYQWIDTMAKIDYKAYVRDMRTKGILVYVGEMGHDNPTDFVEEQYKFLTANGISFAVYAIVSTTDYPNAIFNKFGITERGKLAVQYWNAEK